jgi:2-iminobutanoate/2-iminopropanoate deaminase
MWDAHLHGPGGTRPLKEKLVEKAVVRTDAAPGPFHGAPYNQAIRIGDLVFVAGQLGLKPGHGAVEGDITQQTEQVMSNLGAILEAAGSSLDNLVKTTVYLTSLSDFAAMNEVYALHVGDKPPARATIEVSALPSGALVEIEAVAHL